MSRASDKAKEIVDSLQNDYTKVLSDFGIKFHSAQARGLSANREQLQDTFIIDTNDEGPGRWKEAATVIQELLDSIIRKQAHILKISVEIRNSSKMYQDVSSIIKPNTIVHQACMQVEQAINEKAVECCGEDLRAISYHMRGPSWQTENRKPTIMIRISPGAKSFWSFIESKIIAIVESSSSLEIELFVEILPGYILPSVSLEMKPSSPLIIRHLPEIPINGSSIGARGANEAGTLGVWVDFWAAGDVEKQRCFLTCHHVITVGVRQIRV